MNLEPGTIVDGRYLIEARIGQGGMAVVYRVRHVDLDTLHALKVLQLPATSVQERLMREGRVQGKLNHPNVVSVTDVVRVDGSPGLVMELVHGPSLEQLLEQRHISLDETDAIAAGVLAGVAAAHDVGLIHRDLKPGNILLAVTDQGLVPKVTDFGLAKVLEGDPSIHATRSGATLGTPAYMAPEQIRDAKSVDARADVFSLGAILYEMLVGKRAFDGNDTFDVYEKIAYGRYEVVEEGQVPDRMRQAITAALSVDREERLADAAALLEVWDPQSKGTRLEDWREDTITLAQSLITLPSVPDSSETFALSAPDHTEPLPEPVRAAFAETDASQLPEEEEVSLLPFSGVLVGMAVVSTAALALPALSQLPGTVGLGAGLPTFVGPLGWILAAAAFIVGGAGAARTVDGGPRTGAAAAATASMIAYVGSLAPGLSFLGASTLLSAERTGLAEEDAIALLWGSVQGTVLFPALGFWILLGLSAALGALGGGIVEQLRGEGWTPRSVNPMRLRVFGTAGMQLVLIGGLVGAAVDAGMSELAETVLRQGLASQAALEWGLLAPAAASNAMILMLGYLMAWIGSAQGLRCTQKVYRAEARASMVITSLAVVGWIGIHVMIMPEFAATAAFGLTAGCVVALCIGVAVITGLYVRRQDPITTAPYVLSDVVPFSILSLATMIGGSFGGGAAGGLGLGLLVVPFIPELMGTGESPLPAVAWNNLVYVHMQSLGFLAAATVVHALFAVPFLWWTHRKAMADLEEVPADVESASEGPVGVEQRQPVRPRDRERQ